MNKKKMTTRSKIPLCMWLTLELAFYLHRLGRALVFSFFNAFTTYIHTYIHNPSMKQKTGGGGLVSAPTSKAEKGSRNITHMCT